MQSAVVLSFLSGFLVTVLVGKSAKGPQLCPKSWEFRNVINLKAFILDVMVVFL